MLFQRGRSCIAVAGPVWLLIRDVLPMRDVLPIRCRPCGRTVASFAKRSA
jgi:hypothetical protein